MNYKILEINTHGEQFYDITDKVKENFSELLSKGQASSGVLHLFVTHTSCGLTINESFDPSAARDMESFLKHICARNLPFITHTTEGPDDSPSHMKSILMQNSLSFIIEKGELVLGTWQGIYLCEFRDAPRSRQLMLKYQPDLG